MITAKKHCFHVSKLKDAFFTGCVPNDRHCGCLSNKSLSYKWVASILRHHVLERLQICIMNLEASIESFTTTRTD